MERNRSLEGSRGRAECDMRVSRSDNAISVSIRKRRKRDPSFLTCVFGHRQPTDMCSGNRVPVCHVRSLVFKGRRGYMIVFS